MSFNLRKELFFCVAYWVDGIDSKSWHRYDIDTSCSSDYYVELYYMNPENVDLKSKRCLALVKGKDLHTSKLQSLDWCKDNRR